MLAVLLLAMLGQDGPADLPQVSDVARLTLSAPKALVELDTSKLQGDPARLAWRPNGDLYVKMAQLDRWANERSKHYMLPIADRAAPPVPLTPTAIDNEPAWASSYWLWKSSLFAPGVPGLQLELEVRNEIKTAVGTVRDGGYSQSRADPSRPQIESDVASAQNVKTTTLKLKRQIVAEAVNTNLVPGVSFGWAPAPMGVLAYVDAKKRLTLIDRQGRTRQVKGAANALLPAWSSDGTRLAFLQKKDKNKYAVMVVDVGLK